MTAEAMMGGAGPRRRSFIGHLWTVLSELARWRHLVVQLVRAELRRENARLFLGSLWWVADPLLQMLAYTVLVNIVFARTIPDYPLFVLAALVAWKGLSTTVSLGATAIIGNERIVKQVAFPRIVLPVARSLAEAWRLVFALLVMLVLMVVLWADRIGPSLLWLPVLVLVQLVLMLPVAIFLAAATVFVRDLANVMRHVMRLALYVSPVLYSVDQLYERVPDWVEAVYRWNPVAALLEGYRQVVYGGEAPAIEAILLPLAFGIVLLAPAMVWFHARERRFGKLL